MIGLIGPLDSVDLVLKVARELEYAALLIPRAYHHVEEAVDIALDIEPLCSVILFTGRVPYVAAVASGLLTVRTEYIPHEGTDLYRAIAALLLSPEYRGALPRISFDSIDVLQVQEAFRELGLPPHNHVISLKVSENGAVDLASMVEDHRMLAKAGHVDLCVTCIGGVFGALEKQGIPVVRIVHSRIVIREALVRAQLAMDLSRAQALQVSACILQAKNQTPKTKKTISQRFMNSIGNKYCDLLNGRITSHRPNEIVILSTRGAVERSLQSEIVSRASTIKTELARNVQIGIGFGQSPSSAEENARRAIRMADGGNHRVMISLDGHKTMSIEAVRSADPREIRASNLRIAKRLNLSPTIVNRLRAAFQELDPQNFTSNELASTYGVLPRSARRLISDLRGRGLVKESGIEKSDKAGRPQIAYQIALHHLIEKEPAKPAPRTD
jgi:hypothetical protein